MSSSDEKTPQIMTPKKKNPKGKLSAYELSPTMIKRVFFAILIKSFKIVSSDYFVENLSLHACKTSIEKRDVFMNTFEFIIE
ncbi:hypothetical protein QTP88_000914 [Uroleucon formosanum]